MSKETYLLILILAITLITNLSLQASMRNISKDNRTKGTRGLKYSKLMAILAETIQREFTYKFKLDYELRDIKMIYKFEEDLEDLVKAVLTSFSESFMKELEYYHDRNYIIKYVTKQIELLLLEFTKEKKIKTK